MFPTADQYNITAGDTWGISWFNVSGSICYGITPYTTNYCSGYNVLSVGYNDSFTVNAGDREYSVQALYV